MATIREVFKFHRLEAASPLMLADGELTNFSLDPQLNTLWCWAATTISVARHLNQLVVALQCILAQQLFPNCGNCDSEDCNQPASIVEAFLQQNIVARPENGVPSLPDLSTMLGGNRPIICLVKSDPANTLATPHAVVIKRFRASSQEILVLDPDQSSASLSFWDRRWPLSAFKNHCIEHYLV